MDSGRRCSSPARQADEWEEPVLPQALVNTSVLVLTSLGVVKRQPVLLVAADTTTTTTTPMYAYHRIKNKTSIPLSNNRGQVLFCVAFPFLTNNTNPDGTLEAIFREPQTEEDATIVAVKQTKKEIYSPPHKRMIDVRESNENPYHEIAAMRHFNPPPMQQDFHDCPIMTCLDALENRTHLFIVTPYVSGGDLFGHIPWVKKQSSNNNSNRGGLPAETVKVIFKKVLDAVDTLHQGGVCHRDLKNENIVLQPSTSQQRGMQLLNPHYNDTIQLTELNPILIDLAMSLKVPITSLPNGQVLFHKILTKGGSCGTLVYMAPEVYTSAQSIVLDGYQVDVWCLGVTLFCLLTGLYLYDIPHASDVVYSHFIKNFGLTNDSLNLKWNQILPGLIQKQLKKLKHPAAALPPQQKVASKELNWMYKLWIRLQIIREHLDPQVCDLLQKMLHYDPHQRYTLKQVQHHPWFSSTT